jgi:hypothetical protein
MVMSASPAGAPRTAATADPNPGVNRWMIPLGAIAVHICIG